MESIVPDSFTLLAEWRNRLTMSECHPIKKSADRQTGTEQVDSESGACVIPLIEAEPNPPELLTDRVAQTDYSLVADDRTAYGGQEEHVRTFISDSGVYVVRIIPNEKGRGVTAVMIHTDHAGEDHTGPAPGTPRPFLRINGHEIPFDEKGSASFDSVQVDTIELILRSR